MTITSALVAIVKFKDAYSVTALLTLMGFSVAVMDVVIDGLMVC